MELKNTITPIKAYYPHSIKFFGLAIFLLLAFWLNIGWEPASDLIFYKIRLPKALTAIGAGFALAVSGLFLQTLFRNPLAGPGIIGVSSGASLGVALVVLAFPAVSASFSWVGGISVSVAAMAGSMGMLLLLLAISHRLSGHVGLLIIGLMTGNFALALISIWQYQSRPEAVQQFALWLMGDLHKTDLSQAAVIMLISVLISVVMWFFSKKMDVFLLGTTHAISMGVSEYQIKLICIAAAGTLIGLVTAYCGPVAFVGLAAPHLARLWLKTSVHQLVLPAAGLLGAILLSVCLWLAELPGTVGALPVNAITTLIGAPIVISMILGNRSVGKDF